jgi:hypothetical protein
MNILIHAALIYLSCSTLFILVVGTLGWLRNRYRGNAQ